MTTTTPIRLARLRLALLALALGLLPGCAPDPLEPDPVGPHDGWTLAHPRPGGYDLNAVWGARPADVWAVGDKGVIVHWTGATYTRVDSPTTRDLTAVDGWSADAVRACGYDALLAWDGVAWSRLASPLEGALRDVHCAAGGRLYLAGSTGVRVREAGTWRVPDGPEGECAAVWTGPDGRVRIGNGPRLWTVDGARPVLEQVFADGDITRGDGGLVVIAAHDDPDVEIVYRHVQGEGWTREVDAHTSLRAILDFDGVVRSSNGGVYLDRELIWAYSPGRWVYGLAACEGGILACGYGGLLMYGVPDGYDYAWTESMESVGYRHANALHGTGCDDVWAAEWWGRVLRFDGEAWSVEFTGLPSNRMVGKIQSLGGGRVAALGGGRLALRSAETGWDLLPDAGGEIREFHALAPDLILAALTETFIVWDGATWTEVGETGGVVRDFDAAAPDRVYALAAGVPSRLSVWDGDSVATVLELPGFMGRRVAVEPDGATLWIGGFETGHHDRADLYRYRDGDLFEASAGFEPDAFLQDMSLVGPDDLFVLLENGLWRYRDAAWIPETGLPATDFYHAVWADPDCGVWVEGVPTYFKSFR